MMIDNNEDDARCLYGFLTVRTKPWQSVGMLGLTFPSLMDLVGVVVVNDADKSPLSLGCRVNPRDRPVLEEYVGERVLALAARGRCDCGGGGH